jgi:hypothetical protein
LEGNVELALRAAPAEPVRSSLEEILRAHGRARDLVQANPDVQSRLQESARQPFRSCFIAEEVLTMMRASLPRNVEVEFSCAPAMSHDRGRPIADPPGDREPRHQRRSRNG